MKVLIVITCFLQSVSLHAQDPLKSDTSAKSDSVHATIGHTPNQYSSSHDPHYLPSKGLQIAKIFIAPLAITGLAILTDDKKYAVRDWRNEHYPNYKTMSDDALQYAPMVAVYTLDIFGVRGRNDVPNQTAIMLKSAVAVTAFWAVLKYSRPPQIRPDGSNDASFPSGHTAQAFAAATFLHREYGHRSILYSIGGYTVATWVGLSRILNNKHWLPDVLMGAAAGILSVNLVYLTHQYHWGKAYQKKKKNQVLIMPTYGKVPGLYFCLKLK